MKLNANMRIPALAAVVVSCVSVPVMAQEAADENELSIVVGAAVLPDYEGSDDYRVLPGAAVRGRVANFPFFTRGTHLFVDAIPNSQNNRVDIGFGPVAGVRMNRTGDIKDDRVEALGELNTAYEVGGWAGIAKTGVITSDYDNISLRVSYLKDVGNAHESYVITPAFEYGTPLSETTYVGVSLSADYVGKGYGRYYYDISLAGSQASGLGLYATAGDEAGFAKLNLGLVGVKSLSGDLRKGWSVVAMGGYGRILGDYAKSPVVQEAGSRNQWVGGLGLAYTF